MVPRLALLFPLLLAGACAGDDGAEPRPAGVAPTRADDEAVGRPNLVLIVADDLGAADLGFTGGPARTPRLDALAAEGLRLDRFYAQPLCSPTRAALLTGRAPLRAGLQYRPLRPWDTHGLPANEVLLPELLRAEGYTTALVGKWHLGHGDPAQHPNARGFDHFYGLLTGAADYWTHRRGDALDWQRNGESVEEEGYATELLGAEAARWIAGAARGGPYFLLLSFTAPHTPLQAPAELEAHHAAVEDPRRRTYLAMVEAMDAATGRVLDAVEASGEAEDTLVLFLSDNGGAKREGADNGALRGGKGSCFEGGVRVPAVLRWPRGLAGGGRDATPASVVDLAPTLLAAAGAAPPARALDGLDLLPVWRGDRTATERSIFLGALDERFLSQAVVAGDRKLLRRRALVVDADGVGRPAGGAEEWLLDLAADPAERRNLLKEEPAAHEAERAALAAELDRWLALDQDPDPSIRSAPPEGWSPPADWADAARAQRSSAAVGRRAPSVVVFLADDLGWGDVGFHGGSIPTPHLDALAAAGVRFERFQTYALCTPTRAALLTGLDPMRSGLAESPLAPADRDGITAATPTLAERLRAAGYDTACVGKWHLGHADDEQHPNARGFDRFYGCLHGYLDSFTHRNRDDEPDWQRDGEQLEVRGYATRLLAGEAERWIAGRDPARPFFLYLPFTAPHLPLQAPRETIDRFTGIEDGAARLYAAMVAELDDAVGRVLAALDEHGRAEDTLVLFLSDHGNAKDEPGSNGPLRGGKGSAFEGGIRVPAVLRWPGRVPAGAVDAARRSALDLAPTVLAAAGLPVDGLDGSSLLAPPPPRVLFSAAVTQDFRNEAAVRDPWKLVRRAKLDGSVERQLLFHLGEDPAESHDRAADHPEVVAELAAALDAWRLRSSRRSSPAAPR